MGSFVEAAAQRAEEMRRHLTEKACEDSEFRQRLVSDPKGTIADEFGVEVPEGFEIKVHESDMRTLHLALPAGPELNEEQLETIAAGLCCCT